MTRIPKRIYSFFIPAGFGGCSSGNGDAGCCTGGSGGGGIWDRSAPHLSQNFFGTPSIFVPQFVQNLLSAIDANGAEIQINVTVLFWLSLHGIRSRFTCILILEEDLCTTGAAAGADGTGFSSFHPILKLTFLTCVPEQGILCVMGVIFTAASHFLLSRLTRYSPWGRPVKLYSPAASKCVLRSSGP